MAKIYCKDEKKSNILNKYIVAPIDVKYVGVCNI